jgi:SAM-dependent methyltransferase
MNAALYDSWYDSSLGEACLEVEIALLRRGVGELKEKSVLEVGCGTGRFLHVFGREAVRAVGLDRDPEMLDFARRRRPLEVADHFEWVQGDAAALPFPEASFDLVFESTLLCFCKDPIPVIREMIRVCRPDGRILLGELNPYSPWQWRRRVKAAFGSGTFVGASWHKPGGLLAALSANGCQPRWLGRAIFWPPLNIRNVLRWRSLTERMGARLWPWAGAYYAVCGVKGVSRLLRPSGALRHVHHRRDVAHNAETQASVAVAMPPADCETP